MDTSSNKSFDVPPLESCVFWVRKYVTPRQLEILIYGNDELMLLRFLGH